MGDSEALVAVQLGDERLLDPAGDVGEGMVVPLVGRRCTGKGK